jgi:hypothetical protein
MTFCPAKLTDRGSAVTHFDGKWLCHTCQKVLGVFHRGRLHLKFARGYEYIVGLPVSGVCYGCRTLNEVREVGTKHLG